MNCERNTLVAVGSPMDAAPMLETFAGFRREHRCDECLGEMKLGGLMVASSSGPEVPRTFATGEFL